MIPQLHERLIHLIGTPSVSSVDPSFDMGNQPVIDMLANWLNDLGFQVNVYPIARGKANLVAHYGEGTGGLVFSGHTDTVPCNPEKWQSDPFVLKERNNRFYGLGSCDMKGFFSLAIEAFLAVNDQPFKHPFTIVATCDEECTMQGAKALTLEHVNHPKAVIIGEPTNLSPIRMHKGIMMNRLSIMGKSGHSSDPSLGVNALDIMSDVLASLKAYRQELAESYEHTAFAVTKPTLNLGCIHGGDNPNRICHQCALDFDFRALPGMSNDAIRSDIETRINPIIEQAGATLSWTQLFDGVEPFEQAADSTLVALAESASGADAQAVAFGTEAPFYKALGIDTIVLGPGSIDQAHQPDEFLAFDQINKGVTLLRQFIQHYCLSP